LKGYSVENSALDPDDVESIEDEELQALKDRIADALATLSQSRELPQGRESAPEPFEAEDVSLDSDGWLLSLLQVQDWLFLDDVIDGEATVVDASTASSALFLLLGEDAAECVEIDEYAKITSEGCGALTERLDTAIYLQARYQDDRETLDRQAATERWEEGWGEALAIGSEASPVSATTGLWPIKTFADRATDRRLVLNPSYQRGDVWPTTHCQELIISILRGIPIPSVIVLKKTDSGYGHWEVVDGKQRLTSILRFIGQHPEALRKVDEADMLLADVGFKELFFTDYKKFKSAWKRHRGESLSAKKEAEYYFPFRLPTTPKKLTGRLESLRGKYYYEIMTEAAMIGQNKMPIKDIFNASEYNIPVIEYTNATPAQIHEVFHLYNKQGLHLNAEEIRNALYHELDLMRLLLVASGDNAEVSELAPYLGSADQDTVREVGEMLTDYRVGVARYKRTKLLSWLVSMIMQPSLNEDGAFTVRTTAKHIDAMLLSVRDQGNSHKLMDQNTLRSLVRDLHKCLDAHSSSSCWAGVFQDDKEGAKWQELQLVASLVGVFLIGSVSDDLHGLLEEKHSELLDFTSAHRRTAKSQNKTQWGFIGEVSTGIMEVAGIDPVEAGRALNLRYGVNCLPTLLAAKKHYVPR